MPRRTKYQLEDVQYNTNAYMMFVGRMEGCRIHDVCCIDSSVLLTRFEIKTSLILDSCNLLHAFRVVSIDVVCLFTLIHAEFEAVVKQCYCYAPNKCVSYAAP